MKKSLIRSTIAAGIFSFAFIGGTANAYNKTKFYVGAGADYNFYKVNSAFTASQYLVRAKPKVNGLGATVPMLGVKFHKNYAVEAAYSINKKFKVYNTHTGVFRMRNMYVDLVKFMPINRKCAVFGGLGLGKLMSKATQNTGYLNSIKNKVNVRAKLGINYRLSNNFGLRALASYQQVGNKINAPSSPDLNGSKFIKYMTSVGVGLSYCF